jgi:hypothetical protein
MVSVSSDEAVIEVESSFHAFRDGLLSVVQMAEASDELGLVQIVSSDLSPSHNNHVFEVLHQFLFVRGGLLRHLFLLQTVEIVFGLIKVKEQGSTSFIVNEDAKPR